VKGNRNSRIYHLPGGGSYVQTRANVQCFDTESEALSAGYRRALN
jgi:methylphosphotriester-DNA--protein-cysteine methyltransferase